LNKNKNKNKNKKGEFHAKGAKLGWDLRELKAHIWRGVFGFGES